jgi:tetratricopeptide (TPR) repeat protein
MTATIGEAARWYAAGDLVATARVCLDIIRNDPCHFDALHLLGVVCTNRGQHADGVSYLSRARSLRPDHARLQVNLGSAYGAVQRFDQAADCYRRAIAMGHGDAGVLNNLGLALLGLNENAAAIETYRQALNLDPAHDPALYNLGRALAAAGRLAEAEAEFRRLIARLREATPDDRWSDAVNGFARALLDQGRAEESLEVLRAATAERPHIASIRWHEALVLLLLGRFAEGWRAYEIRYAVPGNEPAHPDHRVLDPRQVAGKRVLVKEEQGRGDVIQFLRYLRPLAEAGGRICLSIYPDLVPLAQELREVETVLGPDQDMVEYDLLTSIMSLPLAFATELATVPDRVPYLRVPASRVGRMAQHLGPAAGRRIGLAWSGSSASRERSAVTAALLEPLLARPGYEFHCLQKEIFADDRAWLGRAGGIVTHETMLRDFGDTAALIEAMDLVISVDTAVAHLAGAMAKPVWIMLAFNPDWRWLLERANSPWYPTARLFRQPAPGDWPSVIQSVAATLPS